MSNNLIWLNENCLKIREFCRKSQFRHLEKGILKLRRAATIKPRKIECSVFFLLDHNGSLGKVKKFDGMFSTKKIAITKRN